MAVAWRPGHEIVAEVCSITDGGSLPCCLGFISSCIVHKLAVAIGDACCMEVLNKAPGSAAYVIPLGASLLNRHFVFHTFLATFFSKPTTAQDLHAAATGANLKAEGVIGQLLSLFDTNVELWSGRLAMIGVLGTIILEGVTGNTLL